MERVRIMSAYALKLHFLMQNIRCGVVSDLPIIVWKIFETEVQLLI